MRWRRRASSGMPRFVAVRSPARAALEIAQPSAGTVASDAAERSNDRGPPSGWDHHMSGRSRLVARLFWTSVIGAAAPSGSGSPAPIGDRPRARRHRPPPSRPAAAPAPPDPQDRTAACADPGPAAAAGMLRRCLRQPDQRRLGARARLLRRAHGGAAARGPGPWRRDRRRSGTTSSPSSIGWRMRVQSAGRERGARGGHRLRALLRGAPARGRLERPRDPGQRRPGRRHRRRAGRHPSRGPVQALREAGGQRRRAGDRGGDAVLVGRHGGGRLECRASPPRRASSPPPPVSCCCTTTTLPRCSRRRSPRRPAPSGAASGLRAQPLPSGSQRWPCAARSASRLSGPSLPAA